MCAPFLGVAGVNGAIETVGAIKGDAVDTSNPEIAGLLPGTYVFIIAFLVIGDVDDLI